MESTYKIHKILRFLVDCKSSRIAMGSRDDLVQHGETSYYIGCSCTEDALVYVKGYKKREVEGHALKTREMTQSSRHWMLITKT